MFCRSIAISGKENIQEAILGAEMAEIRLEEAKLSLDEIAELFSSHSNLLATCRLTKLLGEEQRKQILLTAIRNGAKWVDVEIESSEELISELRNEAIKYDCNLIISYHNYAETPIKADLISMIEKASKYSPQLIKIACKVNKIEDNATLLDLYDCNLPILAIGMSELGKLTRVLALKKGAPFTFVKADNLQETAEGQLTEIEIKSILKVL